MSDSKTPNLRLEGKAINKVRSLPNITTYSDLEDRQKHNDTINQIPSQLQNIQLLGEKGILVRIFKLTETTTTEGGLLDVKFGEIETEGGRFKPTLDDFKEQARGVILSISPEAQKFIDEKLSAATQEKIKPGATIWIAPQAMSNRFFWDRTHPITEDNSYLTIHPNHIEAVENAPILPIIPKTEDK